MPQQILQATSSTVCNSWHNWERPGTIGEFGIHLIQLFCQCNAHDFYFYAYITQLICSHKLTWILFVQWPHFQPHFGWMCVYVRYSCILQQELLETTLATQTKEAYILFAGLLNCRLSQTHLLWQFFYTGRMTVTQECKVRTCFVNPLILCCLRTKYSSLTFVRKFICSIFITVWNWRWAKP